MKTVTATPSLVLPLGRMGENEYTRIQFDVSGWLNELPAATIGLYNQRPQDADAYPVDGITVEDGIVTWTITSAELAQVGKGRCELVAIENSVVAKSAIFNTIVFDALDGSGDAPDPWDSWQETFVALKAEAVAAAQDAETAAEHYPRIVDGIWQVWDVQTGAWVSTGVHATGADGQDGADGVSPTVSVTDISGGHRVTITDADGQHVFDVMDGTDGTDGEDGFSPTVTVTDITGGHRVTVTDADGAHTFDVLDGTGSVQDVQVNGTSVVTDGVANVPVANVDAFGVIKIGSGLFRNSNGAICIDSASTNHIKTGTTQYYPITPSNQHTSAFYALAKAAGDTTQSASSNAVGTYTETAKSKISEMLNGSVPVTGTTPTITALSGIQYVCGEVSTLDITLPASGIVDVVFTSGSTPTVLTVTPPTGVTVKWANGFDPTALEANTTYEIRILNGRFATATAWN